MRSKEEITARYNILRGADLLYAETHPRAENLVDASYIISDQAKNHIEQGILGFHLNHHEFESDEQIRETIKEIRKLMDGAQLNVKGNAKVMLYSESIRVLVWLLGATNGA